jgi:hypothetical protein
MDWPFAVVLQPTQEADKKELFAEEQIPAQSGIEPRRPFQRLWTASLRRMPRGLLALGQVRIPRLIRYVFVYGKLDIVQRSDQGISNVDAFRLPYFDIDGIPESKVVRWLAGRLLFSCGVEGFHKTEPLGVLNGPL